MTYIFLILSPLYILSQLNSIKQPTPEPTKSPLPQGATLSPTMSPVPPEVTNSPSTSPVSQVPTCLLVTTGTGQYDNGYLDVYVNTGDGVYNMVTILGINYDKGQVVLDECYSGLVGVQVTNSQTNAWGGSIESSTDGKITYSAMECQDCTTGTTAEYIVVDGDDNGTGDTKCLDGIQGNVCTLINVATAQPTPEVSQVIFPFI